MFALLLKAFRVFFYSRPRFYWSVLIYHLLLFPILFLHFGSSNWTNTFEIDCASKRKYRWQEQVAHSISVERWNKNMVTNCCSGTQNVTRDCSVPLLVFYLLYLKFWSWVNLCSHTIWILSVQFRSFFAEAFFKSEMMFQSSISGYHWTTAQKSKIFKRRFYHYFPSI